MGVAYTKVFLVIEDKKSRYFRLFIQYSIMSIHIGSVMKWDGHNIITKLKKNRTCINCNIFSTHLEAGIGFVKYIITSFTS